MKTVLFFLTSDSATLDATPRGRESTASAEARSTLRAVKESPNAYPPLKAVAEDLCFILDSCEVWPPYRGFIAILMLVPVN